LWKGQAAEDRDVGVRITGDVGGGVVSVGGQAHRMAVEDTDAVSRQGGRAAGS
jgi:hypothetical protein